MMLYSMVDKYCQSRGNYYLHHQLLNYLDDGVSKLLCNATAFLPDSTALHNVFIEKVFQMYLQKMVSY